MFRNGNIYTLDDAKPAATSLAVRGGRIAGLGDDRDTVSLIGPKTQVIDLQGRLVLPAFHDAHTHPVWGGLSYSQCPLYEGKSPADYQKIIAKCAAEDPGSGWLYGVGWKDGLFTPEGVPDKKVLDAVVPDRPAAFASVGGHSLWVNSKGLEAAGITRETPDPPNGRIDRDGNREAIGALQETAVELVRKKLPPPSARARENALRYALRYFNGLGIVGWHDALVPLTGDDQTSVMRAHVPETYTALKQSGELKAYVTMALAWNRNKGVEQIPDLVAASQRLASMGVEAKAVKFLLDGVPAQRTAALIEPYSDMPGFRGDLQIKSDVLEEAVAQLDAKGFQVHVHTIGDRAVRTALDAFAKARARNGTTQNRHLLSHNNLIAPADLGRFAELGVVGIFQPLWACLDEYMIMTAVRVGPDRLAGMYPVGGLMRAGGKVAYGSDWAVASANPFEGIEVALTRRHPGATKGERLAPDERVTLAQAIRNYTLNAAYALNKDDRSGSLTLGKSADLVVLDRDVFQIPETEIAKTRVLLTLFAGEAVHGDLASLSEPFGGPGNRDCPDCPEMVVVPAGKFQMGSPEREDGRSPHEGPAHTVTFAKPFAIGKYEVTFDEWDACVGAKVCKAVADDGWGRGRRPVIHVNFQMATNYLRWLTERAGKPYRLPSEAEWEYAARAGSTTPWFWGEDSRQACEFGNVGDQSLKEEHPDWPLHACNDGYPKTAPVGTFGPNRFGLHDVAGNVWEWVEDCYNPSYEGAPADGRAWLTGDCVRRLDRGGGWYNKPTSVRSALRYAGESPERQNNTLGFRVARTLP